MTTIISKSGTGIPASDKLETAELAVDTSNGNLYTKLDDGSVVQLNDGADDVDLSDYVTEAPIDTKQYARQDGDWSEIVIPDGGSGSSVHIGEAPPADPQEGQQWMEVPASGDATMWIYDGDKWLQHPSGKDGAPGADGNIADATEQGVIATWDDTAGQWTPESAVVVDAGGDGHITAKSTKTSTIKMIREGATSGVQTSGLVFGSDFAQTGWGIIAAPDGGMQFRKSTDVTGSNPMGGSNATTYMSIDADGDVFTSSNIVVGGRIILSQGHSGIYFQDDAWQPINNVNGASDAQVDLGLAGTRFKNGYFANNVITRSGVSIGTKDIIETLATLREATKDETTIKGLRDAIGNAVGGLIEKFEAMQSTATQEISDE